MLHPVLLLLLFHESIQSSSSCPRLSGGSCSIYCQHDSDCSGRLVCCDNGCGKECVVPMAMSFPILSEGAVATTIATTKRKEVSGSTVNTTRIGQCSKQTGRLTCETQCFTDTDCAGFDKCCSHSCGSQCSPPVKATACIHLSEALSDLAVDPEFIPRCEVDGKFSKIQADRFSFWCVDAHTGLEILGTRKSSLAKVNCDAPRKCKRTCYNRCSHGHYVDRSGCPLSTCMCRDICSGVRCKNDYEICQLVEPDCAFPPCVPVPRCIINPCKHLMPEKLSNGITSLCSERSGCSEGFTCFRIGYNGMGFCCPGPPDTEKPGSCPSRTAVKNDRQCRPECHSDLDCSDEKKCCFDGCTISCISPNGLLETTTTSSTTTTTTSLMTSTTVTTLSCIQLICETNCDHGYKKNADGCRTCDCVDPCDYLKCPEKSICTLTTLACVGEKCPTVARCVVNPCGLNTPADSSLPECLSDDHCTTGYCSRTAVDRGFCCLGTKPAINPGMCPKASNTKENCAMECANDTQCGADAKCCWNGCGLECRRALFEDIKQVTHHGECMPVSYLGAFCMQRNRENKCGKDEDCADLLKCCSDGCSHRCVQPHSTTYCNHLRLSTLTLLDQNPSLNVPECDSTGEFVQIQSHFGLMWCVDRRGMEIPGTRSTSVPDCRQRRSCDEKKCPEKECLLGYQRDNEGCPTCECINQCNFIECPEGTFCSLVPVQCTSDYCLPVPKCVPLICPTGQPLVTNNRMLVTCDKDCPKGYSCTSRGYSTFSVCCPENKDSLTVTCPNVPWTNSSVDGSTCETHCRSHSECGSARCCFNGCGMSYCTILLEALKVMGTAFLGTRPICDRNGNFKRIQCGKDGYCNCVHKVSGVPVLGTRGKFPMRKCAKDVSCAQKCAHMQCVFGFVQDSKGCPDSSCKCRSPCDNVTCGRGEICLLRSPECPTGWCLPVPKCEPTPCNFGTHPIFDLTCGAGQNCPDGSYCTGFDRNSLHGVCCPAKGRMNEAIDASELFCPHGDPFSTSSDGQPLVCSASSNGCPSTHYCLTSPNELEGICCISKRYACHLPLDPGPCGSKVKRFYFSPIISSCLPFDYSGCSGNSNNFETREVCGQFCKGIMN